MLVSTKGPLVRERPKTQAARPTALSASRARIHHSQLQSVPPPAVPAGAGISAGRVSKNSRARRAGAASSRKTVVMKQTLRRPPARRAGSAAGATGTTTCSGRAPCPGPRSGGAGGGGDGHARTCSMPLRRRVLKREAGSAARAWRGPCSAMRPPSRIMIPSARCTVPRRWAMMIAVRPRRRAAHRPLDQALRGRVEAGGGLVQHHQAGISEEDPGEGQELPFARGEAGPVPAQHGVQPRGRARCQLPQAQVVQGRARCGRPRIAGVEEGQVVAHRGPEELHVLGDHRHPRAQLARRGRRRSTHSAPDGSPGGHRAAQRAQGDGPRCRVVEAEQEAGQGGLAAPGAPQEAQHGARLQAEGDPVQHQLRLAVAEGHLLEGDGQGPAGDGAPGPSGRLLRVRSSSLIRSRAALAFWNCSISRVITRRGRKESPA